MKKRKQILLDFVIDKLTNSIQNIITGDSFQTEISRLTNQDLIHVAKKNGWNFNWKAEMADDAKEVYKLTIINNSNIIQGLISLSVERDHVFMNLLENSPFNIGKNKVYEGVAGNLVAFACKVSFQYGFDGYVAFISKTKLIIHYQNTLGAFSLGGHRMAISSQSSKKLVEKYFKT